jgi:type IV secretory pathway VirJ component
VSGRARLAAGALFAAAALAAAGAPAADAGALPLVDVRAQASARAPRGLEDAFVVIVSGDGGVAALVTGVAEALASAGVPVVVLDSLRYFWTPRTPDEAGGALRAIVEAAALRFGRGRALLVGYSRGADALPFMASRLPPALRSRVALVALLGPTTRAELAFHWLDWVRDADRAAALDVGPELEKLRGLRLLCVHGADEPASLCPRLPPGLASVVALPGGHHFDRDYARLAQLVLESASPPEPR